MKKVCLLLVCTLSVIYSCAQAPNFQWAKGMGDTLSDVAYSIAVEASGNNYTTGYFKGTVDFDPGVGVYNLSVAALYEKDVFIQKLDVNGNFLWAKQVIATSGGAGGNRIAEGNSITVDKAGNILLTGYFWGTFDFDPSASVYNLSSNYSSIFILKLDSNGNFIWAKKMGGINDNIGYAITTDRNNNVYTTGYFMDTVDFDPGTGTHIVISNTATDDIFIQKLDSNGNFVWVRTFGTGSNYEYGNAIATDTFGNIYTIGAYGAGYLGTVIDFDPGSGVANLVGGHFILKLDPNGDYIWVKSAERYGTDFAYSYLGYYSLAIDATGDVYTAGIYNDTVDFDPGAGASYLYDTAIINHYNVFIQKLDANGNFIWVKSMGSLGENNPFQMITDASLNIYTIGLFTGTVDFDPGVGVFNLSTSSIFFAETFIQKLDASGNFLWALEFDNGIIAYSVALDTIGGVYAAGYYYTTVDFNPGIGTYNLSAGSDDIFNLRLGPGFMGTSENSVNNGLLILYPNPVSNQINIEFELFETENVSIEIKNTLGQTLKTISNSFTTGNNKTEIDVSEFSNGVYFVQLQNGMEISNQKFIKQ